MKNGFLHKESVGTFTQKGKIDAVEIFAGASKGCWSYSNRDW